MLLGLTAWALNALLLFLLAYLMHRELRTERPSLNAALALLIPIALVTAFMLSIGLIGWLKPLPIAAVSALGVLVIVVVTPLRTALADLPGELAHARSHIARWWTPMPRWLKWLAVTAAVMSVARFGFLIWTLPPFVWDSLSYHLTNVAHWVQVGRIETFETPVTRIFNPANFELLASWFAVFLHHDVVIEAAGLPAYGLAIAAVYSAARGLGSSSAGALIAGLAYGSTPAVVIAATGTKNDIHMAAYYLFAIALIIQLKRRGGAADAPVKLRYFTIGAVVVLLALGTKTYILHLIPGLILIAVVASPRVGLAGLRPSLLRDAARGIRDLSPGRRAALRVLAGAGLFIGLYWNARNLGRFGNPFYPYDVVLADREVLVGPDSEFRLDVGELRLNLEEFAGKFGDWQDPIRPDLPNTTGWGWFAYALGLPALAWSVVRRPAVRVVLLGFVVSLLVLFLSAGPSPWNLRFFIWFPAVFSLAFSAVFDALGEWKLRRFRTVVIIYTLGTLALNFTSTLNYGRASAEEFRSMLELPVRERHTALFQDNMPEAYTNAVVIVPSDQVLGYNVHGNGFVYPLYRSDFSQRIVYVPITAGDTCESIAAELESRSTRYLLVAPEHTEDATIATLRECANEETVIRERARGIYVLAP